jgi:hypothetical protein
VPPGAAQRRALAPIEEGAIDMRLAFRKLQAQFAAEVSPIDLRAVRG